MRKVSATTWCRRTTRRRSVWTRILRRGLRATALQPAGHTPCGEDVLCLERPDWGYQGRHAGAAIGHDPGVEIFYGVNARIWANPVSCSQITFFVGCSLLPPNRKSTGIRTIRTTPTLRGANQSSRTETHTPNPLLPLDLHYSIRNVHPDPGDLRRGLLTGGCEGLDEAVVRWGRSKSRCRARLVRQVLASVVGYPVAHGRSCRRCRFRTEPRG